MSEPGDDPRVGLVIEGRYRLESKLRGGALGDVFRARDGTHRDGKVVVELLHERLAAKAGVIESFLEIARNMSRARHPSVMEIEDFGRIDRSAYVVTEWVEGKSLEQWANAQPRLTWMQVRPLAVQIVGALAAAHRRKIIHGALRTDTCFVLAQARARPTIKVGGFGVEAVLDEAGEQQEVALEDLAVEDEAVVGDGKPSIHTDIRAASVILVYLLSGERWAEGSVERVRREGLPGLPNPVVGLIQRMLSDADDERFDNTQELLSLLENPGKLLQSMGARARSSARGPGRAAPPTPLRSPSPRVQPFATPSIPKSPPPGPLVPGPRPFVALSTPNRSSRPHAVAFGHATEGLVGPTEVFSQAAILQSLLGPSGTAGRDPDAVGLEATECLAVSSFDPTKAGGADRAGSDSDPVPSTERLDASTLAALRGDARPGSSIEEVKTEVVDAKVVRALRSPDVPIAAAPLAPLATPPTQLQSPPRPSTRAPVRPAVASKQPMSLGLFVFLGVIGAVLVGVLVGVALGLASEPKPAPTGETP